ncbi:hypothetical protein DNC80_08455 [Flavobacterium sp. SOK18b]|uniref:hypothetical protein n=1 Tax=Flavobacterium sp. SOK18b TaxID=797900 RepID=UPI0015FA7AB9|nr:hypothetical protein [Flavobacterium sp. SOK18b]MBB1193696.1 hypothetical protein [Flavobacterium sp. SOK18b]
MKNITLFLAFIGMMTLQSCEVTEVYEDGPRTEVFEVTTSFGPGNGYSKIVDFDPPIGSFDSVLVYHLFDVVNGQDIWRLMPQTYYLDNGRELDYNFDYTRFNVNLFLTANFSLNTLSPDWTQNQTFKIVIVPDGFAKTVNKNDINAVMSALKVQQSDVKKITL